MSKSLSQTSLRLPKEALKEAERLGKLEEYDKSIIMRQALEIGLERLSQEIALKMYAIKKVTLSEAADIAHLSIGEMMQLLCERGIKQEVSIEDIKDSIKNAEELI